MNTFKKVMMSICLGLLFGVFGGLGFYAVQRTTGLTSKDNTAINEQSVEANVETEKKDKEETPVTPQTAVVNTVGTSEESADAVGVTDVAEALMPAMVSINKEYEYSYGTDFYSYYFGGGDQKTIATASGS